MGVYDVFTVDVTFTKTTTTIVILTVLDKKNSQ